MNHIHINAEILKALHIDTHDVQRVVLLIKAGRLPRLRVTRALHGMALHMTSSSVHTYELITKHEKPMRPLSLLDAVEAISLFEVCSISNNKCDCAV